jgi:hypothetical protein
MSLFIETAAEGEKVWAKEEIEKRKLNKLVEFFYQFYYDCIFLDDLGYLKVRYQIIAVGLDLILNN